MARVSRPGEKPADLDGDGKVEAHERLYALAPHPHLTRAATLVPFFAEPPAVSPVQRLRAYDYVRGAAAVERRPATADIFSRLEANKRRLEKEIVGGGRSGFAPGAWQVYDPNQGGARRMRMASKRAAFAR